MSKTHDESRRGFLKTVGIAVGAAVAVGAGCSAAPKKNTGPALSSGGGRVDVEKVDTIMKAPDYREIDRLYFVQVDEKKCEACGQCQDICATGAIQAAGDDGPRKIVDPAVCMNCGQCLANCPYGAIYECGSFVDEIFEKIKDPDVQVVAMPAPAVRYGLGECFGMPLGTYVGKKMFTALRKLGFDHIWDNQFTADVTIMEEGSELVGRIKNPDKKKPLPQFTSCCPAWIKFVETFHPEILPHISTCKSPIGMLGPLSKTYGAKVKKTDPSKIYTVSIMPCIAKKYEGLRPEMRASEHRDIDATITTRELAYMIKKAKIDFKSLKGSEPDFDLGESTGGATIFGCSGGVMEAALRFGYFALTGKNLPQPEVKAVRAHKGVKEAMIPVPGVGDIKVCVISGLDNAKPIIKQVKEGKCPYHFIEVMTCPGGCVNGGGQPIPPDVRVASAGLFRSVIGRMNRKFNMRSMGKGVKS